MNLQLAFFFLIIINFIIFINKPDIMFWGYALMALDFGGYFSGYTTIYFYDPYFLALFLPLLSPNIKVGAYINNKVFRKFFIFLLSFAIIYHILIYGFYASNKNFTSSLSFVYKHRLDIFGFLSMIPAYIFTVRKPLMLFKVMVIVSIIPLVLYAISLMLNIELLPIDVFERYLGSGIMRKSMRSYVFAQFLWPFALLLMLDRKNIRWKNLIYIGGILIIIIQMLTLTRRIFVFVIFQMVFTLFIHKKYFHTFKISSSYIKIGAFMFITFLLISVSFPKYITYTMNGFSDIVTIITTGESVGGIKDGRMESDIPEHIARFKKKPFFGTGFDPIWYDSAEGLSANDMPLTAALGMFGSFGFVYFGSFYFMIGALIFTYFKKLRYNNRIYNLRVRYYPIYLMVMGFFVLYFVKFTVYIPSLFLDLIVGKERVIQMLYFGIFLGLLKVVDNLIAENKI